MILKKGMVFLVRAPDKQIIKIFGDAITFRAYDRTKIKYKEKYLLEFFKI